MMASILLFVNEYQSITNIKSKSVHDLAVEVTKPFEKPEEKVQAIYYWVTHNIKYDYKKFLKFKKKKSSKKRFTKKEIEEQELKEIKNTLSNNTHCCFNQCASMSVSNVI